MSTVALPSQLLHANAVQQSAALLAALRAQTGSEWQLDASVLADFDSSALSVLLQLRRDAAQSGKTLRIAGATAKLHELAGLYGVAELLA
jgi:phospholipid transport system transporter-binding protein